MVKDLQPRKILHVGFFDFLFGIYKCLLPSFINGEKQRTLLLKNIENHWQKICQENSVLTAREERATVNSIVTLSIRSGFDLLLDILDFPKGSEILVSAITIADIPRIIEDHGLIPVPLDIELNNLSPKLELLEQACTENTKMIVIAHLFGSKTDLTPYCDFAASKNIMLIEDCAQNYQGPSYVGHPQADISMFSFGSIKTFAACGGAILNVKDNQILSKMKKSYSLYPIQNKCNYCTKLIKYMILNWFRNNHVYYLFSFILPFFGTTLDKFITQISRGFTGAKFFNLIRNQASIPLLQVLLRRLKNFDSRYIERRQTNGNIMKEGIIKSQTNKIIVPGYNQNDHVFWVFPILLEDKTKIKSFMDILISKGFDVTQGASQLAVVKLPDELQNDERKLILNPKTSQYILEHIVYIPVIPEMTQNQIKRELNVILNTLPEL